MRPKKVVLCVGTDEMELSVRKYMLSVWGFKVFAATTEKSATRVAQMNKLDVVVIDVSKDDRFESLIAGLRNRSPETGIILTSTTIIGGSIAHGGHRFLGKHVCTPTCVLEAVKIAAARRRGPKPAVAVALEMAG